MVSSEIKKKKWKEMVSSRKCLSNVYRFLNYGIPGVLFIIFLPPLKISRSEQVPAVAHQSHLT